MSGGNGELDARSTGETTRLLAGRDVTEQDVSEAKSTVKIGQWRAACIMLNLSVLIFLQSSNLSGMTTAQSAIAAELDAYENAMWFTSAFLIAMSSMSPLIGRLASVISSGTLILATSAVFAVGGVIASQASSFGAFMVGRVICGVGASGVMTLPVILVLQLVPRKRRGLFVGSMNCCFTVGLSTGAVVAGALIGPLGWRVLFLSQAPIALVAGLGVWLSVPSTTNEDSSGEGLSVAQRLAKLDYAGAFALTLTIVLFLYGLSGSTIQLVPILLSLVSMVGFVLVECYVARDPVIPLEVLQSHTIFLSCLSQLGFIASRWTVLFYGPIYMLAVRGLSPALSGSVLIPTNIGYALGNLVVGILHLRRGGSYWLSCLASIALFAVTLFSISFASMATSSMPVYISLLVINGFATGAGLQYTLAHLLHLAPAAPKAQYTATSLFGTFRGFAGSFGTAIGGGFVKRSLQSTLSTGFQHLDGGLEPSPARQALISRLIGSPGMVFGSGLDSAERQVAVHGYEVTLKSLYQGAAMVCILVLLLQAGTGWAGAPKTALNAGGDGGGRAGGGVGGANDEEEQQPRPSSVAQGLQTVQD